MERKINHKYKIILLIAFFFVCIFSSFTNTHALVVADPDVDSEGNPITDPSSGGISAPSYATIRVAVIVCNLESDLPNWSYTGTIIGSNTATDYVNSHPGCRFQSGWPIYWGSASGATNFGGTTDSSGFTSFAIYGSQMTSVAGFGCNGQSFNENRVYVSEANPDTNIYYGFADGPNNGDCTNTNKVSAEMRCYSDNKKYDNFDFVKSPGAGGVYNCIAFNALKNPPATINVTSSGCSSAGLSWTITPENLSGSGTSGSYTVNAGAGGVTYTITPNVSSGYRVTSISSSDGPGSSMFIQSNQTKAFNIQCDFNPCQPAQTQAIQCGAGYQNPNDTYTQTTTFGPAPNCPATVSDNKSNICISPPNTQACRVDSFPDQWESNGIVTPTWATSFSSNVVLSGGQFGSGVQVESDGSRSINISGDTTLTITANAGATCSPSDSKSAVMHAEGVPMCTYPGDESLLASDPNCGPPQTCSISYFPDDGEDGNGWAYPQWQTNASYLTLSGGPFNNTPVQAPNHSPDSTVKMQISQNTVLTLSGNGGQCSDTATFYAAAPPPKPDPFTGAAGVCSSGQITLSWGQSPGVGSYILERNGTKIWEGGNYGNGAFTDTGRTAGVTYSYTVYGTSPNGNTLPNSLSIAAPASCPVAPTVTITANPTSVSYNTASSLSWSSTNATSCTASNGWSGSKVTAGSQSTGNLINTTTYTLTCSGPGGSASASATVTVGSASSDLISGNVTPTLATTGVSQTYSSTISNIGPGNTGSAFVYFFQVASSANGGGTITDLPYTATPALASGANVTATKAYTFGSAGTYSMRTCADKSSSTDSGQITESNENNNCGGWTNITVTDAVVPSDLISYPPSTAVATVGVPDSFPATALNVGSGSTVSGFNNLFQVASSADGGGTITDLPSVPTTALAAGTSRQINSNNYTFSAAGTYSMRMCVDKSSSSDTGTISESNESNNCSGWTNISVSNPPPAFDYTLSNPGSITVTRGGSAQQTTISTVPVTGSQAVTISNTTSSMPTGLSAVPSGCVPSGVPCTSTITVTASSGATAGGPYNITFMGSPAGASTVARTLSVTIINPSGVSVTCSVNKSTARLGESVTWSGSVSGGTPPYTTYAWTGTGVPTPAPTGASFSTTYSTTGTKTAQLTVTDSLGAQGTCTSVSTLINFDPTIIEF